MKDLLGKVRELPETSNTEHMQEPKGPGQPILLQKVGRAGAWSGVGWCPCSWSLLDSEPQAEVLIDWVLSCVPCPLFPSPSREGPSLRTSILEGKPSSSPPWFLQNTKKIWMLCSFMTKVHSKYDSHSPISTATVHQLLRTSVFFRHWARGFSCRIASPYHNPLKYLARCTFSQVVQWERLCLPMQETPERRVQSLGSGRSPGIGNGNPLSILAWKIQLGRGAWQATVHELRKSWTWLSTHALYTVEKTKPWRG